MSDKQDRQDIDSPTGKGVPPSPEPSVANNDEPDPIPVELEIEAAESAGKSEKKLLIMALVVIACIVLAHFTPLMTVVQHLFRFCKRNWRIKLCW